jgi:hypothetical protein
VGNITGGNLITAGLATVAGNITGGNLVTTGTANVNALRVTTTASATGNITGGNLITAGLANVAGNIDGGNLRTPGVVSATGNVTAPNFIGNVVGSVTGNISAPGSNTYVVFNDSGTANATVNLTFNKTTGALSAGGNISAGGDLNVTGSAVIAGNLTVSGTTEYTNVSTMAIQDPIIGIGRGANNAPLSSNDGKDRGEQLWYYSGSESSAFIGYQSSSGNLIAAANVTITNEVVTVNSYGNFIAGTLVGAVASVTGNVNAGNVYSGNLSLSGNVISVLNATGNITGANVRSTGLISATGNVVTGANVVVTGYITATGNITGGNVLGGANVNATTHTGTTVSVTGNITSGNVTTAGLTSTASLSVTGNTATVTTANYQIGYRDLPQVVLTGTPTLAATDGGKHYYGSGTITIPASGTTNFAIGTAILIIASNSTTVSPAVGVTLLLGGSGASGARTIAQYGVASLVKVAGDTWYITGAGVS